MIDKNTFIPFHHYTIEYIENFAKSINVSIKQYGDNSIGQKFLSLLDIERDINFSFTSVSENDYGLIYICVFNGLSYSANEYQVIRTEHDDFLVHVHHQYDHYDKDMQFIGSLPYHLYQLAKNTLNNEKKIRAHSALDALQRYGGNNRSSYNKMKRL